MAAESPTHLELELGHVLFMDAVGYSKLLINEQREVQRQLTQIVRSTEHFRAAEAAGSLLNASSLLGHSRVPMICEV